MNILDYIEWRLDTLNRNLKAKSGVSENDNLDDIRILAQLSELIKLKESLKNGEVHCS
jgi:hypothetical protein